MVCEFILGRRGSGKTEALYDKMMTRLSEQRGKVHLVLPEQATFLHEKRIATLPGNRSLLDLEITSFRRMSRRHVPLNLLDPLGCHLLVYKLLKDQKEKFQSFRLSEVTGGVVKQMLQAMSEASMNLLCGDDLRKKAEELEKTEQCGDLPRKLQDLALLMDASVETLEGDTLNENELLLCLEQRIREKHLFCGDLFCFDDFFDFTAAEYRLLDALMSVGADLIFAFPHDAQDRRFRKTTLAMRKIRGMAQSHSIVCDVLPVYREDGESALDYLERHYSQRGASPFPGDCSNITILSGPRVCDEVEGIAKELSRLHYEGVPWGEMGICFRDAGKYLPYIKEIFPLYQIPFYYDDAQSLLHHPIFSYCRGLLRLAEERWSFLSVFALLKSGLFPMEETACDLLENYCLAHGIRGSRFYQEGDWIYEDEDFDLGTINEIRHGVASFLKSFTDRLGRCRKTQDYAAVLWDFVDQSHCAHTLSQWRTEEETQGRLLKAEELSLGLDRLGELLDQLVAAFPEDSFSTADFASLFEMGCRVQKLNTIPPGIDEVEISILGQSRPPVKDIVFLGGVNEGVFPNYISAEGFFNRRDREFLSADRAFWQRDSSFFYDNEMILVYQGLTLARKALYLSYCTGSEDDLEGGPMEPSEVIVRVKELFPQAVEKSVTAEVRGDDAEIFFSTERLLSALPMALRNADFQDRWENLLAYLRQETYLAQDCDFVLESLTYNGKPQPLNETTLSHYIGDRLFLNVSSMDVYRRCPFSYFAKYGLKLKERKELVFDAPNLGSFFHEVLRALTETMAEERLSWSELAEKGPDLVTRIVSKEMDALEENYFPPEQKEFMARILTENLLLMVKLMAERVTAGDAFYPVRWEASFGPGKELNALTVQLDREGKEIILTGQIDRVDLADGNGKTYFRVIDYKSSDKDLDLDEIYYGLKLQLLVYMAVIEKNHLGEGELSPAGMFYLSAKDLMIQANTDVTDEEIQKEMIKESRMKGFVIGEESKELYPQDIKWKHLSQFDHDVLMKYLEASIKSIGEEICGGNDEIAPYVRGGRSGCDFCPYRPVCGYDAQFMAKERELTPLKHSDAMAKILEKTGYGKNRKKPTEEGGEH